MVVIRSYWIDTILIQVYIKALTIALLLKYQTKKLHCQVPLLW
jgi:hypothetical protein